MTTRIRIAVFCGISRLDSSKQKLLDRRVAGALEAGVEARSVYVQAFDLPICGDDREVENGIPLCAGSAREEMASHHILLIATPEYNGRRTALLKNLLDWFDCLIGGAGSGLDRMVNRSAAIVPALAVRLGAIRSQIALRFVLRSQLMGTVDRGARCFVLTGYSSIATCVLPNKPRARRAVLSNRLQT